MSCSDACGLPQSNSKETDERIRPTIAGKATSHSLHQPPFLFRHHKSQIIEVLNKSLSIHVNSSLFGPSGERQPLIMVPCLIPIHMQGQAVVFTMFSVIDLIPYLTQTLRLVGHECAPPFNFISFWNLSCATNTESISGHGTYTSSPG
jgi:hypothetical protein